MLINTPLRLKVLVYRSSRIKKLKFQFMEDSDQTALQRSKPISCTILIGEQPNL
jgi:hypothetical protein